MSERNTAGSGSLHRSRLSAGEIISFLEKANILELQALAEALSEKYASFTAEDETERRAREEAMSAYWTPWYHLVLIGVNDVPGTKLKLIKKIRELSGCTLAEAKETVENPGDKLPMIVWRQADIHPSQGRDMTRSIREELEALGALLEEDYNYGYFD